MPTIVPSSRVASFRRLRLLAAALAVSAGLSASIHAQTASDLLDAAPPFAAMREQFPPILPALKYPGWFKEMDKLRMQVSLGRYRQAILSIADAKLADPEADILKAMALSGLGRDAAATAILSPLAEKLPAARLALARVLRSAGNLADADKAFDRFLAAKPGDLVAMAERASLLEQLGDLEGAKAICGKVRDTYYDAWNKDSHRAVRTAEEAVALAQCLDRWATLNRVYEKDQKLNQKIVNTFLAAYDLMQKDYWPAHLAAAEFYLRHDREKEGMQELAGALAGNPSSAEALYLLGQVHVGNYNFAGAEQSVSRIRQTNPTSFLADLLTARIHLIERQPRLARESAQKVLKSLPNNIEALGLLAASHALSLEDEQATRVLAQVDRLDPDNYSAYLDVADALGAMRQYPRSEAMYLTAVKRAPWNAQALNGLALLYTQSGDEDKARAVIDQARVIDPFNYRTTNYLILLEDLAKFARVETEHFIVMYDKEQDPFIAEYMAQYMEGVLTEASAMYQHMPATKTLVEIFPTHDAFSVRTTGSPWIGTMGASTGRVIALCAPRLGKKTMGNYNWAQVMRHEFTHTITLSATDNRISHWLTEGLAVESEKVPLRWEWGNMLAKAAADGTLFRMEDLSWMFIRPRRPQDRSMAYAQSWWVVQFMREKFGTDAVPTMIRMYRQQRPESEIFASCFKMDMREFDRAFQAWAKEQSKSWGFDAASSKKFAELTKKGEDLIKAKKYAEAEKAFVEATAVRALDPLPHQRLAGLYLSVLKQPDKAIEHLTALQQRALKDNRMAKRLARLILGQPADAARDAKAMEFAREAVFTDPYDIEAHRLLADAARRVNDAPALERQIRVIPLLEIYIEKKRKEGQLPGAPDMPGVPKD